MKPAGFADYVNERVVTFIPCRKCQKNGVAGCSSCLPVMKTEEREGFSGPCGVNLVMLTLTFLLSVLFGVLLGVFHLWLRSGLVGLSFCKP